MYEVRKVPRDVASKHFKRTNRQIHMSGLLERTGKKENKSKQVAKNKSLTRLLGLSFGFIILGSGLLEGGSAVVGLMVSIIGIAGIYYVAYMANRKE